MLLTDPGDRFDEPGRRRDVTALTEHRFQDHRGGLLRRRLGLEQMGESGDRSVDLSLSIDCEGIGERGDEHAARERGVAGAVAGLRGRHRHRHVGATVEAAGEHDDVGALGGLLGELHRGLGDLGARVGEEERVDAGGRQLRQPRRQRFEQIVAIAVHLRMDEPRCLALDGGHHVRMRVPGGRHRDARGEVEVLASIGGVHPRPRAVGDLQIGDLEPDGSEMRRHGDDATPAPDQGRAGTDRAAVRRTRRRARRRRCRPGGTSSGPAPVRARPPDRGHFAWAAPPR